MSSKYINGSYPSGYKLSGVYTSLTIGPSGSIGGTGLIGGSATSYMIVNLGAIAASVAGDAGITLGARGTITNGSSSDTSAYISGAAAANKTDENGGNGVSLAGGNIVNYGTIRGGNGGVPRNGRGGAGGVGISLSARGNIVNSGTVTGGNGDTFAGGAGISLSAGGNIRNFGTITGGYSGASPGAAGISLSFGGNIRNSGTIIGGSDYAYEGVAGAGIAASSTCRVTNHGAVFGGTDTNNYVGVGGAGISLAGGGTVANSGTIAGGIGYRYGTGGAGVSLADGGTVTNSGTIMGGGGPNFFDWGAGIVLTRGGVIVNSGTIAGGYGIELRGGRVENGSEADKTATISGEYDGILAGPSPNGSIYVRNFGVIVGGIVLDDKFSNTVVNFGTISDTSGNAIAFGSGNNLLVVEAGAVFSGVVDVGGGANTIELEKAGTMQFSIGDFGASDKLVFSDRGFKLGLAGATQTPEPLPPSLFIADSTGKFTTTTQRFAYDTATGQLFYDAHGSATSAARELVVTLDGDPHLAAGHLFFVS